MNRRMILLLLALAGCDPASPLPVDQVCKDTIAAVASRVFSCTGDLKKSNDAADQVKARYQCQVTQIDNTLAQRWMCASRIQALPCDKAAAYGDNWDAWLFGEDPSAVCRMVFAPGAPVRDGGAP